RRRCRQRAGSSRLCPQGLMDMLPTTGRLWIAVGIRRRIAAFEMNLVRPVAVKFDEEVLVECHASRRIRVDLDDPALHALRIELRIPGAIKGVAEVDTLAVAAHLDHLRSAVEDPAFRVLCM